VQFPTGGKAREPFWHDPVKLRSRQYSLDGRRCGFAQIRPVMPVLGLTGRFFRKISQPRLAEGQPFSAGKETMSKTAQNTRKLAGTAMLSAIGFILMFIELSVPIMPAFIKLDFSELPALLATFAYGPGAGAAVCLVKNVIHIFIGGTTAGVGELSNFLMGVMYVVPAGLIYQKMKSRKGALVGSLTGCVISSVYCLPHNYFLIYPLFGKFVLPLEAILGMYQTLNPNVDGLFQAIATFNVPFTFAKEVLTAALAFLIYKPLSPILHGRK